MKGAYMDIEQKAAQIRAAVINDLQRDNVACGVCEACGVVCQCKACAYTSTCKHTAANRIKCACAEYIVKQITSKGAEHGSHTDKH